MQILVHTLTHTQKNETELKKKDEKEKEFDAFPLRIFCIRENICNYLRLVSKGMCFS